MAFSQIEARANKLRERMYAEGLDAFALFVLERTNLENCRYLSGFSGSNAALLITRDAAYLVSDGRYASQAKRESPFEFVLQAPGRPLALIIAELCESACVGTLGVEFERIAHGLYMRYLSRLPLALKDASALLPELRRRKDTLEVGLIARASDVAHEALEKTLSEVRVGWTERQFENALLFAVKQLGGERGWTYDDYIVVSGERGALPHGRSTTREFKRGDLVTVDYGVTVEGYLSDVTRNFVFGEPTEKMRDVERVLMKAHTTAAAALRPGIMGCDVDEIARKAITDGGYGKYFIHGLGHGLGLEVHEAPRLAPRSEDMLEVGDVVTIEPGIYIEEWGGMRIEDDYLITQEGAVCLSHAETRPLRVLK
jgi:Xaa-Pro aminopeptidase